MHMPCNYQAQDRACSAFYEPQPLISNVLSSFSMVQGTFCNVPSSCEGVALADGTCCPYELSKSGFCCEVVDKDMECCASGVLDAAGVCQGTAVSINYNGVACTVRLLGVLGAHFLVLCNPVIAIMLRMLWLFQEDDICLYAEDE